MLIQLSKNKEALLSDEDADLANLSWFASMRGDDAYAARSIRTGKAKRVEYLHRVVAARALGRELERSDVVDHVNGDRLDNRRENLKVGTTRANISNQRKHREGKLVGCYFNQRDGVWLSRIRMDGRQKHLGSYATELEAHVAYKLALEGNHGQ